MENINFLTLYLVTVAALWIFLLVAYRYQTDTSLLKKKGYNEEYRTFLKNDSKTRIIGIAIAVPLLELLAGLVVKLITGELSTAKHLGYAALLFVLFVLPFPILDMKRTGKKYRELAIKTKSEIMVDFNYRTLHLVFKPALELIALVLYILYFVVFIDIVHPAMLHLAILWFLYYSGRMSKNLTGTGIRDAYLYLFVFMVANHLLVIFHLVREIVKHCCLPWHGFLFGIVLTAFLLIKLGLYLIRFPRFKKEISANIKKGGENAPEKIPS